MLSFSVLCLSVILPIGAPQESQGTTDVARWVGTWQMTAAEKDGEKAPDWWVAQRKFVFSADGGFVLRVGDQVQGVGTFRLGQDKGRTTVDLKTDKGDFAGKTLYCLYELNGDELRVCFPMFGTDRPTQFTGAAGSRCFLMTFRRTKAKE
jgi:uncharacterized protein (TIGR03067 family)